MTEPILRDFPDLIETARLTIRCHRPGDGPRLFEALEESLRDLRKYPASLPWVLAEHSAETCEKFARESHSNFIARRDLPFLLFARGTDFVIGSSGLHRIDWAVPKFEVGYWGRSSQVGKGLITEGVRAIVDFAFSTLAARRVEALPDDENERSCRVCERLGFTLEGTLRHDRIAPDGTLRNTRIYAKIQ
jgi:RimJ/RimL family protein N-acetyltransferase